MITFLYEGWNIDVKDLGPTVIVTDGNESTRGVLGALKSHLGAVLAILHMQEYRLIPVYEKTDREILVRPTFAVTTSERSPP